jgi:predicted DNA-binding protein (MmcQ/YjbR family)
MHVEDLRQLCLSLPATEECFPFDSETLVFKVCGKMFCLVPLEKAPLTFNVKCDPERAIELREHHSGVQAGWHMSKTNWNTVVQDGSFTDADARQWVIDSYRLVVSGLPKKVQATLTAV